MKTLGSGSFFQISQRGEEKKAWGYKAGGGGGLSLKLDFGKKRFQGRLHPERKRPRHFLKKRVLGTENKERGWGKEKVKPRGRKKRESKKRREGNLGEKGLGTIPLCAIRYRKEREERGCTEKAWNGGKKQWSKEQKELKKNSSPR